MRFVENGPAIPDRLLRARDEGQVVFFCGAGVSRARAGLHDFSGLANAVADSLGSARGSAARRLIDAAAEQRKIQGLGSLLPTDRVFSLLEREFEVEDVRNAVAKALQYAPDVDRSAHRILLDLARGPDGTVRLVTTNFDRLFEEEDPSVDPHIPPLLPRPNRPQEWDGVVYLHGRLGDGFKAPPAREEFVLSSTDFGRAYLSDGWATAFIRGLMEQFQLVFVGYAADDPPVQYLLEALNGSAEGRLYAFQSGPAGIGRSLWAPKGVEALSYSADDGHVALWSTLGAWADRARNPEAWTRSVLSRARSGPRSMAAHERGQVKHLISSAPGAGSFYDSKPPAEWLCVFDPWLRYAAPTGSFDPFEAYALDDDIPPPLTDPDEPYKARTLPLGVWSAFEPNEEDRSGSPRQALAALSGPRSVQCPNMPPRLGRLASWIGAISNDPITPWWAARQGGLHPHVIDAVRRDITTAAIAEDTLRAWSIIFTSFEQARSDFDMRWFDFVEEIKAVGWDHTRVLRWANLLAPVVRVSSARSTIPPNIRAGEGHSDDTRLLNADVDYPKAHDRLEIPDDLLARAVELVRRQLIDAQVLELHARGYLYLNMPPIRRDTSLRGDTYGRDFGISRLFFRYVRLLERLAVACPADALAESRSWPNDRLFDRLRLWAPGVWTFWPAAEFAATLKALNEEAFWDAHGQRDLLLSLSARWADFSPVSRSAIVSLILKGPPDYSEEPPADRRRRRAYQILDRLEWLQTNGCDLGERYAARRSGLLKTAGPWSGGAGLDAARSLEGSVGFVRSDEDPTPILDKPPRDMLAAASDVGKRDWSRRLEEKRPFRGVVKDRPVRAFAALMANAGEDGFAWAWEDFFYADGRKIDQPRFRRLIARRLARLPAAVVRTRIRAICHWMEIAADGVHLDVDTWFTDLWVVVISALREDPSCSRSGVSHSGSVDWVMLALNSPAGDLAQGLMTIEGRQGDNGFNPVWLSMVEDLLTVGGEVRRYASILLLRNLAWFNYWAPTWTGEHLLAMRKGDSDDRDAFWHGMLWASNVPPANLFDLLKDEMIELARGADNHDRTERLAGFLLMGWGSKRRGGGRYVSNEEMRELLIDAQDSFRTQIIWHLKHWQSENRKWRPLLKEFLEKVWPRQRAAKSSTISSRFFDLAIESPRNFVQMVDLVEPLMTTVDADASFLFRVSRKGSLVVKHPEPMLRLIYKALPRDAGTWPWGAEQAINLLAKQPAVVTDSRMAELRRRLAAR